MLLSLQLPSNRPNNKLSSLLHKWKRRPPIKKRKKRKKLKMILKMRTAPMMIVVQMMTVVAVTTIPKMMRRIWLNKQRPRNSSLNSRP